MVDLTAEEQAAMRQAMKMQAEVMEEIGWQTRLCDLSQAQVLSLIEVAIASFQEAMAETAQAHKQDQPHA